MAVPKRFGKGSALVAVGGSDRENARTDIAASVRYVTDPEARVRDMDKRGVEAEVVYPTLLLSYLEVDVALEVAICGAYNRYLAEAWKTAGDRLRWVVVPPLRDMEASVREIEAARDHGAVGRLLPRGRGRPLAGGIVFLPRVRGGQPAWHGHLHSHRGRRAGDHPSVRPELQP